jgi:hypothetical protein
VLWHIYTIVICRSMHKSAVRKEYMQEIQDFCKLTLLDTRVTPVGTPSSGSALDNTCIWTDLGILKPTIYQSINQLTAIVPPRTTLGKILSSTCEIGKFS